MFAKVMVLAALALFGWAVAARPLGAHGQKAYYRVRPYDTVWTIAAAHYAGDVRDAVWRIEHANHLRDPTVQPGEVLRLP
jgi:nucleoid-associated protein YgaU